MALSAEALIIHKPLSHADSGGIRYFGFTPLSQLELSLVTCSMYLMFLWSYPEKNSFFMHFSAKGECNRTFRECDNATTTSRKAATEAVSYVCEDPYS